MTSFQELGLTEELLRAVKEKKYATPTPIQQQVIPLVLEGGDLLAGSQTGTGKTAGFTLPLLQRLSKSAFKEGKRAPRALILCPTRELAMQIGESVRGYGKYLPLKSALIFGGVNMKPQEKDLKRGVDILIATPGRLLDHVSQKNVDLSAIEILVLDEADRMLDMGFIHDIRRLLALMPKTQQNLLFSATFSQEIKNLAASFLKSPKTVTVAAENATAERVAQTLYSVDQSRKRELLYFLITSQEWKQVLVFTRTKHGANKLAEQLHADGIPSSAIHGNKSQAARTRSLKDFKQGKLRVLVATDIAARGIDIDHLPYVVNFELPSVPEDYVHRIGRTGRAGKEGRAISFVGPHERHLLRDVERLLKVRMSLEIVEGYAPDRANSSAKPPAAKRFGEFNSFKKRKKPFAAGQKSRRERF